MKQDDVAMKVVGWLLFALMVALVVTIIYSNSAEGAGIRVFSDSSTTQSWGLIAPISTSGTALKIDSAHAHSFRGGIGDNAVSVSRRSAATSGDADSAWISRVVYAGDTVYIFRDLLSDWLDIDTGPAVDTAYTGYYEMVVKLFADDQPTETHFEFEWIRSGYRPVNVVHISGDATAADNMEADYDGTGYDNIANGEGDWSTHSAADVTNDWETQSQADPTGFHVNVLEIEGTDATTQMDAEGTSAAELAADVDTNMFHLGDTLTFIYATLDTLIDDSLGSAKNRVLKALPDKQPSDVEGGGVLVTNSGGGTGYIMWDATIGGPFPYVNSYMSGAQTLEAVVAGQATSAAELAARPAIGDTNQFNLGDSITMIVAGNCGSSNKNVVFYVIDTSGVDDTLPNANVYMLNSGQTAVSGNGVTGGVGVVTIGLNESTTYNSIVRVPGYNFPAASVTTTAGSTPDTVDLKGYDLVNTATPSSHYTTLTGEAVLFNDTLKYAIVEISLTGASAMYSSIGTMAMGNLFVKADANGDWSATIPGTDSLSAYVGGTPTYCVRYFHPLIQNGGKFTACNLSIPANGSTTKLRDILAQ